MKLSTAVLWGLLVSGFATACASVGSRKRYRFAVVGDDPNGALKEALEQATARWAAATGVDIGMAPTARHVIQWATPEQMPLADDGIQRLGGVAIPTAKRLNGKSFDTSKTLIRNDVHPTMLKALVTHEIGHVLAAHQGHSLTGVMHDPVLDPNISINDESLSLICEGLDCKFMVVEPDPDNAVG